jgi:hypothetical protein
MRRHKGVKLWLVPLALTTRANPDNHDPKTPPLRRGLLCMRFANEGRACLAAAGDVRGPASFDLVRPADVELADALDDRASFRRVCGFSANEATPERTTFVKFRGLHTSLTGQCLKPSPCSSKRRR